MEREIEKVINSFFIDFDQRKLALLDKMLFSLLFKKELLFFKEKDSHEIAKIERILSRYRNYRNLILKRLTKKVRLKIDLIVRILYPSPARLILLLTHSCQLKCRYCRVRKFSASMNERVLFRAVDLLFTSNRNDLQLQFFGGEPLLRFDLVQKAVEYAEEVNQRLKRDLTFILTTNGIALTKDKVDFFKKHKFIIECSIDGEIENQLKMRRERSGIDYYSQLLDNLKYLFNSGVMHYSISVAMPQNAATIFSSFKHLVSLGFKRLQMNYSLGVFWPEKAISKLFKETAKIANYSKKAKGINFINLTSMRKEPVVLNAELTVDCDGAIYLESGICLEEDFGVMKSKFLVTDISKAKNLSLYASTAFQNFYRLTKAYSYGNHRFRKIILNNILLGHKYGRFIANGCHDYFKM